MLLLCLISPDFATLSLALHKHVVSVVFKRLSTFTNLLLSTLAPMFFFFFLFRFCITLFSPSCLYSENGKSSSNYFGNLRWRKSFSAVFLLCRKFQWCDFRKILKSYLQRKCFVAFHSFSKKCSEYSFLTHIYRFRSSFIHRLMWKVDLIENGFSV